MLLNIYLVAYPTHLLDHEQLKATLIVGSVRWVQGREGGREEARKE